MAKRAKDEKFPRRVVLGEGWPWASIPTGNMTGLYSGPVGGDLMALAFPKRLRTVHLPKYRLILERVDR